MDFLILSCEKDYNKLPFVIESIEKNIENYEKIWCVCPTKIKINSKNTEIINDNDALPNFDRNRLDFYNNNWIFQQVVKLIQNFTNKEYVVIDSDTIILKNINPKTIYYRKWPIYEPYEKFNNIFNLNISYEDYCFVNEFMFFDRDVLKILFERANVYSNNDFFNIIYNNTNNECFLSEYQLYGNFIKQFFFNKYEFKKINKINIGKCELYFNKEICDLIKQHSNGINEFLSIHTYV